MKSYDEWRQEKETEQTLSELDFGPAAFQAMRSGGVTKPQLVANSMPYRFRNPVAELDAILSQSIVPLKQFVSEHPELLNMVSKKLHSLWMNVRTGTQMPGRPGLVSRRMDQITQ